MHDQDDLAINLISRLRSRLELPLPGRAAQEAFAPAFCKGQHFQPSPESAKQAAVLMLLYPCHEVSAVGALANWRIPLTLRPLHMKEHAGQISLPGGRIEPGESIEQAACREAWEELAINGADVKVLGALTPIYLYVSDFVVTPILAFSDSRPDMRPNPDEVAQLIELDLERLCCPEAYGQHDQEIPNRGSTEPVPHIAVGEYRVWGATAIMLAELAALI